ncbi:S-formylglutathione hydrolase [Formicincola oecophyllae]|uniref:S-formylglutathione hydrolase n=1 Tax=Formicincola oecophyllae TaxID=2558361 RepID=A0A4Y6UD52_9PROT|nr:S-formylglutathione hydrolase [Formicincola oecophyllae]QDH14311.1 S-formylglutathione hydrolase [Formicincola oecophyllae]
MPAITTKEYHKCCGGEVRRATFTSQTLGGEAAFSLFLPKQALAGRNVPVIYVLAGLTCTEETFLIKANAVRHAAQHGLALVCSDTSPRGAGVPTITDEWDIGPGAGYYVNATAAPWQARYRMWDFVRSELPTTVENAFPLDGARRGVMGHSMGGMGALALALREPGLYQSASMFAPICNPSAVPWGEKATQLYFGGDSHLWDAYDPCRLLASGHEFPGGFLVDQGLDDPFLKSQLHPDALENAARKAGQALKLRRHEGYDHSYWFVQSFIAEHIRHHAEQLNHTQVNHTQAPRETTP